MAYKINDDCISCGACQGECPVNAISEGDGKFVIDPDTCIECGAWRRSLPGRGSSGGMIPFSNEKGKYFREGRTSCFFEVFPFRA